jgi:hypothetical protein
MNEKVSSYRQHPQQNSGQRGLVQDPAIPKLSSYLNIFFDKDGCRKCLNCLLGSGGSVTRLMHKRIVTENLYL